jgi:16S rRNA (cytosine967-C5)-methyltransferase
MKVKRSTARSVAIEAIYQVNEKGGFSNIVLSRLMDKVKLDHRERPLATELVYGTIRWQKKLDWIIEQFSKRPLNNLDPWIKNILRLGIYQIFHLSSIPPWAACNETVQLAKRYSHPGAVAYVNGLLRNVIRGKDALDYSSLGPQSAKYLAVFYSHPQWLVEKWLSRFGFEATEGLLKANNLSRSISIRTNTLKTTVEELTNILRQEGINPQPGRYFPEALMLERASSIVDLSPFQDGLFVVQNEASMLPALILAPRPGEIILDACAAPGGKTVQMAQLMGDVGEIIAGDVHSHRLDLIENNCRRLGITSVRTKKIDARLWSTEGKDKFHRILVDAPCSGTGVLSRRPDARWQKKAEQIMELSLLQREILLSCADCVKPGGVLVYSTCSLEIEENQYVVKEFLSKRPDFGFSDLTSFLPTELMDSSIEKGCLQTYPQRHKIDGFFVARMVKDK